MRCYVCDKLGHISIDCPRFSECQGNHARLFGSREFGQRKASSSSKVEQRVAAPVKKAFKEDETVAPVPVAVR